MLRVLLLPVLVATTSAQAPQPPAALEVATTRGQVLRAASLAGEPGRGYRLQLVGTEREQVVPAAELLAVHGVAVQSLHLAAAFLRGGEVVRGALLGGDPDGDFVNLLSPVLGSVMVPIDRLAAFVPAERKGLRPEDLPLPDGVDEALFTSARVGFDLIAGSLHRFDNHGVRFAAGDTAGPESYRLKEFVALRIADPMPRAEPAPAMLLTRTGDRVGVRVLGFGAGVVRCVLESGREVAIRDADLACLTFLGAGTFLSDLEPAKVTESGYDGPVLHPHRRDRSVLGGALLAAERTHAKGLGVHSASRLTYVVPEGVVSFWTRVALDDSAASLPFRANVDVRVLYAGKVVFEQLGLEVGATPRDVGMVSVQAGEPLVLEVAFGKGRELGDRVDWLTPVFLPAPVR